MGDGQAADRPPVDQEARWISFADLAMRRGISRASASKLVRRHGWRRQTDNQGRVLILVPAEALDRPADGPLDRPTGSPLDSPPPMGDGRPADSPLDKQTDTTTFKTALAAIEASHAAEIAALREACAAAETGRTNAQALADRALALLADAEAVLTTERQRSDATETAMRAERLRAEALRDRLDAAEAAAQATRASEAEDRAAQAEDHARQAGARATDAQDAAEALRRLGTTRGRRGGLWRGSGRRCGGSDGRGGAGSPAGLA
jgi:hypothetical protein